jgi:two-component system sensor histidine kinase UhpB
MTNQYFSQQIEGAQKRLESLEKRSRIDGEPGVSAESLMELSITLEELRTAQEELLVQNEELIHTREAIEKERRRYQDLFNHAPDGYLITDLEGVIQEANRMAAQLLNVSQKHLIGKPLLVFVESENRKDLLTRLTQLKQQATLQNWEVRLHPRFASPFDAAVSIAVKRDGPDELGSLQWLIRNITEQKQARELQQENAALNRAILSSLGMHIALLDKGGTIIAVNEAWERFAQENGAAGSARVGLGINYLEVCRQASGEFADQAQQALAGIQAVLAGLQPHFSLEYECPSPTEKRWFLLQAAPLAKSGSGAVVSHQDISEQKLIAEEINKLLEAVSQQRGQLRGLTQRLSEVQELERKRLAQELHDQVGRNLTALGLNLNIMASELTQIEVTPGSLQLRLNDSLALVEQTTEIVRDVMADLRPPVLDDYGLIAALRWYSGQVSARAGLPITVQGQELTPRLALFRENALFRIAQEALTNIVKHAQATQATVTVEADQTTIRLIITDDGVGFEPNLPPQNEERQTWGLLTMTERAEAIGGQCQIKSGSGKGTRVIIQAPRAAPGEPGAAREVE